MIIQVIGIGFHNMGALLMLQQIKDHFEGDTNMTIACELTHRNYSHLKHTNIKPIFPYNITGSFVSRIYDKLPQRARALLGLISEKDVDIVLDCSGFAYGDFWGESKLSKRLARHLERWKTQGKQLILLPQAFGPFSSDSFKAQVNKLIQFADLIYVRDRTSFSHLQSVFSQSRNISQSPDFTCLVKQLRAPQTKTGVAIVPNEKIISSGTITTSNYIKILEYVVNKLMLEYNKEVSLILHETTSDKRIADTLSKTLPIKIIQIPNPVELKEALSHFEYIISSRYHAILSALNSGVPAIVIGWSHKYNELMTEWGIEALQIDPKELGTEKIDNAIKLLETKQSKQQIETNMLSVAENNIAKATDMWCQIDSIINNRKN